MSVPAPGPFGQVVWVELPARDPRGREQEGARPCLVILDPGTVDAARYPLVVVVPMTSAATPRSRLYPRFPAGSGGLSLESAALLDQLLAVDVRRVRRKLGALSSAELDPVREALREMLASALELEDETDEAATKE